MILGVKRGRWGNVTWGQMKLMDCSIHISPPLRIPHDWVADGTGKVWCRSCGVPRHPDYVERDAAREERLAWLKRKQFY